jgi:hypothetical protein
MAIDVARAHPPRHVSASVSFRLTVAVMHLLQPLVRIWGRSRNRSPAREHLPDTRALPSPALRLPGGVLLFPEDRPRADFALRSSRGCAARVSSSTRRAAGRTTTPGCAPGRSCTGTS